MEAVVLGGFRAVRAPAFPEGAFRAVVFFAAVFFAAVFLAVGFFGGVFFEAVFLLAALRGVAFFLAADFFTGAFFAAVFLVAFLGDAFLTLRDFVLRAPAARGPPLAAALPAARGALFRPPADFFAAAFRARLAAGDFVAVCLRADAALPFPAVFALFREPPAAALAFFARAPERDAVDDDALADLPLFAGVRFLVGEAALAFVLFEAPACFGLALLAFFAFFAFGLALPAIVTSWAVPGVRRAGPDARSARRTGISHGNRPECARPGQECRAGSRWRGRDVGQPGG